MFKLTECENVNCFQRMLCVRTEMFHIIMIEEKVFMQFLIIWHLCSDVIKIEKTQKRTLLFEGVGTIPAGKAMAGPKFFRLF